MVDLLIGTSSYVPVKSMLATFVGIITQICIFLKLVYKVDK